jgi:outer membrane murein-binding lipoprotein Lpp
MIAGRQSVTEDGRACGSSGWHATPPGADNHGGNPMKAAAAVLLALLLAVPCLAASKRPPAPSAVDSLRARIAQLERDCGKRTMVKPRARRPASQLAKLISTPCPEVRVVQPPPCRPCPQLVMPSTINLVGPVQPKESWWHRNGGLVVGAAILGGAILIAANNDGDDVYVTAGASATCKDCGGPILPPHKRKKC